MGKNETPYKERVLELLKDGSWHTTSEVSDVINDARPDTYIGTLRCEGWNIVSQKDKDITYGYQYRLALPGESAPKRIYKLEEFIELLSDCSWHSMKSLKEKYGRTYQNHLKRMRKEGFSIEKEYDPFEKCFCYRLTSV